MGAAKPQAERASAGRSELPRAVPARKRDRTEVCTRTLRLRVGQRAGDVSRNIRAAVNRECSLHGGREKREWQDHEESVARTGQAKQMSEPARTSHHRNDEVRHRKCQVGAKRRAIGSRWQHCTTPPAIPRLPPTIPPSNPAIGKRPVFGRGPHPYGCFPVRGTETLSTHGAGHAPFLRYAVRSLQPSFEQT